MFGSRQNREEVVCIACGTALPRSEAREYDKQGNRWDRKGKEFEYLCKDCHRDLDHQPRADLEATLVEVERSIQHGSGTLDIPAADDRRPDRRAFLEQYFKAVEEGTSDDRGTDNGHASE